jgi:hypothetical protein
VVFLSFADALLGLIFSSASATRAQDQPRPAINDVFGPYGFHSDASKVSGAKCIVFMTLVQKTFLEKFPELQKLGLLNDTLDQSEVFKEPNTLSLAFMFQLFPVATKEIYDDNLDVDKYLFEQTMTVLDDYGNDKTVRVASYGFTRAIYKRINWDNFPAQNIIKVAPGFRLGGDFEELLSSERNQ